MYIFEDFVLFSTLKTPNFSIALFVFWNRLKSLRVLYRNNRNNNNNIYYIIYSLTIDLFLRNSLRYLYFVQLLLFVMSQRFCNSHCTNRKG